jgi:glutamyl-tRNA synthetase
VLFIGRLHLEGNFKTTEKKLTWLPVIEDLIDVELVEYDHLITKSKLDEDDNFIEFVNDKSKIDVKSVLESINICVRLLLGEMEI